MQGPTWVVVVQSYQTGRRVSRSSIRLFPSRCQSVGATSDAVKSRSTSSTTSNARARDRYVLPLLLELALRYAHHGLAVTPLGQSFGNQSFSLDGLEFLLLGSFPFRRFGSPDPGLVSLVFVCESGSEEYRVSVLGYDNDDVSKSGDDGDDGDDDGDDDVDGANGEGVVEMATTKISRRARENGMKSEDEGRSGGAWIG